MHLDYAKAAPVLKQVKIDTRGFKREIKKEEMQPKIRAIAHRFPNVNGLPQAHETAFLTALSFYPELRHASINIKKEKIKTTMVARPHWKALFKKKNKHYELIINNTPNFQGVPFESIPFNAKVGVIGHELAHLLDYENKNNFQLLRTLIQYMYKKGRTRYEHAIDYLTICKGLGWQLRDWAQWAMYDGPADEAYKAFKRSEYLAPDFIEKQIHVLTL